MKRSHLVFYVFLSCFSLVISSLGFSCSRLLHVDPQAVMVGRNMDWFEDMHTKLVVLPRGMDRNGYAQVNPLRWTSKYGSIIATAYNAGATDGMNEKGLAGHVLWLDDTDYGKRDESIPGLSIMMWIQFYLDNFQTVDEAVRYTQTTSFQVLPFYDNNTKQFIKVHLALEDAYGDSAIIEYIDGKAKIYHSKEYTVLTNEPVYNVQLDNLKQYDGFGGSKPLPGTESAEDRFVRTAYHGARLPAYASAHEAAVGMLSVMENASPPFAPFRLDKTKIHRTIWRTIADLTHHVYYFNSMMNMTMLYADLDKFSLQQGSPVMKLDLEKSPELSGDATSQFEKM